MALSEKNQKLPIEVQRYLSKRGEIAVSSLWKKNTTILSRREHIAPAVYARISKSRGEDAAFQWMVKQFGMERGMEMLLGPRFNK